MQQLDGRCLAIREAFVPERMQICCTKKGAWMPSSRPGLVLHGLALHGLVLDCKRVHIVKIVHIIATATALRKPPNASQDAPYKWQLAASNKLPISSHSGSSVQTCSRDATSGEALPRSLVRAKAASTTSRARLLRVATVVGYLRKSVRISLTPTRFSSNSK